jgi:hypothetical protein
MPAGRQERATAETVDVRLLLRRYVPYLRYDSLGSFRADSAAVLPEHFVPAGTGWSGANVLRRREGTVLAAARPRPGQATLTLDFLRKSRYADGTTVRRDDVIDAVGRDYVADARRMHADPRYADVCYGSVAHDRDGIVWLQYWFFYYYNDKTYFGYGAHEGDWEMIQLRLGAGMAAVPTAATYAQHNSGQALRWSDLDRRNADGHPVPVVFVARGSHASFARAGRHDLIWPLPPDYADGRGPRVRPRLEIIGDAAPGWAGWPGLWGSSDTSPRGPVTKRQWTDPGGFHRDVADAQSGMRAARDRAAAMATPGPPAPRITVHRLEDRAVVAYRFPVRLRSGVARPAWVVVAVDGRDDDLPPATYAFPVPTARGVVAHPLPLDDRPYLVRVTAYSEDAVAGRVVTAPVPA